MTKIHVSSKSRKYRRVKYKLVELGGSLKSAVVLSDKQLELARREFEKSWAGDNK